MRGSLVSSTILVVFLAQNFHLILTRSLPRRDCITSIQIDSDMSCQTVADLCDTSLETLIHTNPYFRNGDVCDGRTLTSNVEVCCEFSGGPQMYQLSTPTTTQPSGPTEQDPSSVPNTTQPSLPSTDSIESKCFKACLDNFDPICGTDGITYTNQCYLDMAACANPQNNIKIRSQGSCISAGLPNSTCTAQCSENDVTPVCGNDGITYTNQCFLELQACRNPTKELFVSYHTACKPSGQLDHCKTDCPSVIQPVCGTNNISYVNRCFLELEACKVPEKPLRIQSHGNCENDVRNPQTFELGLALGLGAGVKLGATAATLGCFSILGPRCTFPFVYKGVSYNRCTTDGFFYPWCATSTDPKFALGMVTWGKCGLGCELF